MPKNQNNENTPSLDFGLGLGFSQYRSARRESREEASSAKSRLLSEHNQLTKGNLNGTDWSQDESRKALYDFAKSQGLDIKSRISKGELLKALSAATAAQG